MTLRLISPDRKLFLMADEDDLKAVAELYKLTSKQKGNIRHCSATAAATAMTALSAKRSENFMLFHTTSTVEARRRHRVRTAGRQAPAHVR